MSFAGDLYPTAGATSVMTTKGDMVDYNTARQRLGIGSANQILQVKSGLPSWETLSTAGSVLTTQGDVLYEGASALARLGQSTDNFTLATKGAGANPAWQASSTSVLTTTGDLLYASSANVLARLAGGTSGDVLTANGAGVAPSYQTPSGGGIWVADGTASGTSEASLNVPSMTGRDITHIFYQVEPTTLVTTEYPLMRINGIGTSTYDCCIVNQYVNGGSPDIEWNQSSTGYFLAHEDGHNSEYQYIGDIWLYKGIATQEATGNFMTLRGLNYRNDQPHMSYLQYGGGYQPDDDAITDVQIVMSSGNISGKIQVNSMDYQ